MTPVWLVGFLLTWQGGWYVQDLSATAVRTKSWKQTPRYQEMLTGKLATCIWFVKSLVISKVSHLFSFSKSLLQAWQRFSAAPGSPREGSDSQVIVLVPLWVQSVFHSVGWVALPRAVHNNLGKGVGKSWGERAEIPRCSDSLPSGTVAS